MTKHKQSKERNTPVHTPSKVAPKSEAGLKTDRETAVGLLRACLATEVRCVAEVVRYARAAPDASRKLLEDILAIEQEHAAGLMGLLRMHDVAT